MCIFRKLEIDPTSLKPAVTLSKMLSIPCSNAFVEGIFSLMSSHKTDMRNQCHTSLIRAELQVQTKFMFDCIQFYHHTKEKKGVLKAAGSPEKYWRRKQRIKIPYCTMEQKATS